MLHFQTHGDDTDAPPLLIAHGLFGSARNWGAVAKRLSATRKVVAVDMRNHGASAWFDTHGYEDMAADLAATLDGPADVLGHSMGGKAAMVLALTRPDLVRKLVVADIAPVPYSHSQLPMIEAMQAVDLSRITTRREADDQLATQVENRSVRAFLLQSLDVNERIWRLNLDVLRREMDLIMSFPKLNAAAFDRPSLFLAGAYSDYVGSDHRPTIKSLFPAARFAKIPGAGHWLHADNPRAFEAAVETFLAM